MSSSNDINVFGHNFIYFNFDDRWVQSGNSRQLNGRFMRLNSLCLHVDASFQRTGKIPGMEQVFSLVASDEY
jgi:hypothetical protein